MDRNYRNILEDLHDEDQINLTEQAEALDDVMPKEGAEFILCDMCRHNRGGKCRNEASMANQEVPVDGLYFGICKGFSSEPVPISPAKFKKLMQEVKKRIVPEPSFNAATAYELRRYNMEHLMAQMLMQLGYGEGAKVFLNESYELFT